MDINDIRSAVTLAAFVLFAVLVGRTWSRRRQGAFDEAARLPLVDDAAPWPPGDDAAPWPPGDDPARLPPAGDAEARR